MNCDNDAVLAGPDDLRWLSAELESAAWESGSSVAPAAFVQPAPRPGEAAWPLVLLGLAAGTLAYFLVV